MLPPVNSIELLTGIVFAALFGAFAALFGAAVGWTAHESCCFTNPYHHDPNDNDIIDDEYIEA